MGARKNPPPAGRQPSFRCAPRTRAAPAPERAGRLAAVTGDWLFQACSVEGRVKLLREHELLAA